MGVGVIAQMDSKSDAALRSGKILAASYATKTIEGPDWSERMFYLQAPLTGAELKRWGVDTAVEGPFSALYWSEKRILGKVGYEQLSGFIMNGKLPSLTVSSLTKEYLQELGRPRRLSFFRYYGVVRPPTQGGKLLSELQHNAPIAGWREDTRYSTDDPSSEREPEIGTLIREILREEHHAALI